MQTLSPLQTILASYRNASQTEREKGNYFEELIRTYLRYEPTYADLYSDVWLLKDVPAEFGISKRDTGIDLVARTNGSNEFHAIQRKFLRTRTPRTPRPGRVKNSSSGWEGEAGWLVDRDHITEFLVTPSI